MEKCKSHNLAEQLTGFLMKLNEGKNDRRLRQEANRLITHITPGDITRAEQRLARNGLSTKKIQQLSATFVLMGVLEGNEESLRARLSSNHILRRVMAEHEIMQCFLADLEEVAAHINQLERLGPFSYEFRRLTHIIEHLNSHQEHIAREDDVLFPALKKYGWTSLFEHIESEHIHIQMSINDLVKLIIVFDKMPFGTFKKRLMSTVRYLCPLMREHLFHEDRALFPLAISMIDDDKVWENLRRICDEIDYCGIHL